MMRILLLLIGYGCGLVPSAYLYGKYKGIDITHEGSGNPGATNTLRVMGKKAGLVVFLLDLLKALVPCLVVRLVFAGNPMMILYVMYMGLGVILGHNYPVTMHFKGGKGISSTSGFILVFDLRISLVCLIAFIAAVALTKYVSLGSLLVVTFNLVLGIIFGVTGLIPVAPGHLPEYVILLCIITGLAYLRHRMNIVRLVTGTENKLGSPKEE